MIISSFSRGSVFFTVLYLARTVGNKEYLNVIVPITRCGGIEIAIGLHNLERAQSVLLYFEMMLVISVHKKTPNINIVKILVNILLVQKPYLFYNKIIGMSIPK